jgi:AraC family transcriptional activator of tynA and feaB
MTRLHSVDSQQRIGSLAPETINASGRRFSRSPQLDFEAWRAFLRSKSECKAEVAEPIAFAAWMRSLSICGLTALAVRLQCGAGAMNVRRDAYGSARRERDVRGADVDWYTALFQVAGQSALTQNDRAVKLAAGDVALVDGARPSTCCTSNTEWLSLRLPRQSLVSNLGFEPKGGAYACGRTPAARLLFGLVRDAAEGDQSSSSAADSYLQLAIYDLLGALFAPSAPVPVSPHASKLLERICDIIKGRFADPAFGPPEVAAEAGISLRYLQKLFSARNSTCTHFILSLRLDHAARLLHRRELLGTRQPISEIAYACGFADHTNFARRFRRRFGRTPGSHSGDHA